MISLKVILKKWNSGDKMKENIVGNIYILTNPSFQIMLKLDILKMLKKD